MSDITCELVWDCIPAIEAGLIDMNTPEGRAEFWRMWVTLERELAGERYRQATALQSANVVYPPGARSPTDSTPQAAVAPGSMCSTMGDRNDLVRAFNEAGPGTTMASVLGALAGVMAASQAPRPKDEDDGA